MPKRGQPRRGSLQFWPRSKAKRIYPAINFDGIKSTDVKPLAFAGWKAGMTHVQILDTNANSPTHGKVVSRAVTILDAPPLFVCGLRFYKNSVSGLTCIGEEWFEALPKDLEIKRKTVPAKKKFELKQENTNDVRLIVATQPRKSGMKKLKPDVIELALGGDDVAKKIEYAKNLIGKEISLKDIFHQGEWIDVTAVTKGHGYTGPVKRFGIRIQTRKDKQMHRHAGSIGSTVPRKVDWRVPLAGQYGFFTRTEFNKRLISITDPEKVNQNGGIVGYGLVKDTAALVEGSVPGPSKRLIILRKPSRAYRPEIPVDLKTISVSSKQGV